MRIGPLGIWELLIILVVILVIFGPRRLPEMAKGIGQSVREFRKGIKDMTDDFPESAAPSSSETARAEASPPLAHEANVTSQGQGGPIDGSAAGSVPSSPMRASERPVSPGSEA